MKLNRYNLNLTYICLFLVLLSFICGLLLNEDSLAGAYHDYKIHENYFSLDYWENLRELCFPKMKLKFPSNWS